MTGEELAQLLRAAHPDAEPTETDPAVLAVWIDGVGGDGRDAMLTVAALVAWEQLIV